MVEKIWSVSGCTRRGSFHVKGKDIVEASTNAMAKSGTGNPVVGIQLIAEV